MVFLVNLVKFFFKKKLHKNEVIKYPILNIFLKNEENTELELLQKLFLKDEGKFETPPNSNERE